MAAAIADVSPQAVEPEPTAAHCERPTYDSALRFLCLALIAGTIVAAWTAFAWGIRDNDETDQASLRLLCLATAALALSSHVAFASWVQRRRSSVDVLRRRTSVGPLWSWVWIAAPLIAAPVSFHLADRGLILGLPALYLVLGVLRAAQLSVLGDQVRRVAKSSGKGYATWGLIIAASDVMFIGVGTYGLVSLEPQRDRLANLAGWGAVILMTHFVFALLAMKKTERVAIAWWDDSFAVSDAALTDLLANISPSGAPTEVTRRRLIPTMELRLLVIVGYVGVAAAALWGAYIVWSIRDAFGASPVESFDDIPPELVGVLIAFIGATVVMQILQGLWSMAAAWNARRSTIMAPHPLGMATLFSVGPAIVACGLLIGGEFLWVFGVLGLIVNQMCWFASFRLLARTLEGLGGPRNFNATWGWTLFFHWMLGYASRPLEALDGDAYAAAFVALGVVDAAFFVAASVAAWKAMSTFDDFTRNREQIRQVSL